MRAWVQFWPQIWIPWPKKPIFWYITWQLWPDSVHARTLGACTRAWAQFWPQIWISWPKKPIFWYITWQLCPNNVHARTLGARTRAWTQFWPQIWIPRPQKPKIRHQTLENVFYLKKYWILAKKMGFWAIVPRTDIGRVANIYIDLHVYKLILGLDTVQSIQMIRSIYIYSIWVFYVDPPHIQDDP